MSDLFGGDDGPSLPSLDDELAGALKLCRWALDHPRDLSQFEAGFVADLVERIEGDDGMLALSGRQLRVIDEIREKLPPMPKQEGGDDG